MVLILRKTYLLKQQPPEISIIVKDYILSAEGGQE